MSAATGQAELWASLMQGQALLADAVSDRLEAEAGIPLAWYEVLAVLADAPEGALRMQDLGQSMWLSKSGLTRLCDRIEEEAGRAKVREARPVFARASQDLFLQHLSPRERHALESAMRKIIGANRGHLRKPERADDQAQASPKR